MARAPERPHFLQERCLFTCNRFPWVTAVFFSVNLAIFYHVSAPLHTVAYRADATSTQWGTTWSYAFFHVDSYHLWSNMIIFFLGGALLEATDTNGRMLLVTLCAIPYSAMGHGFAYVSRS